MADRPLQGRYNRLKHKGLDDILRASSVQYVAEHVATPYGFSRSPVAVALTSYRTRLAAKDAQWRNPFFSL